MGLNTKTLNESLETGYVSEAFQKDGKNTTFVATFSNLTGTPTAKLQQSVECRVWSDVPRSSIMLDEGQGEQMWNENILPEGIWLRLVVGAAGGELTTIKMLSK
ncbi:MAG: hypothetical protein MJZ78_04055 [Bacteroidales bacterium]|nr:hypothetical protein [Bacteroidales bacterium]